MKKLLFILLATPLMTHAQKSCKYDVDSYDKFLKITKKEKAIKINKADALGNGYLNLNVCKYDSLVFFRITYIRKGGMVVGTNDAIIFLFEDGTTIKALPDRIYSGNLRSSTHQFVLDATYFFEIPGALSMLNTKRVKAIRIYYNGEYSDHDLKSKFSDLLQETAKCF